MRTRTLSVGLAVLGAVALGWTWTWVRLYPGPAVQAALDAYAPGLPLGGRVPMASTQYALRVAPYLGYRDSGYMAPAGLHDLGIRVNEYVDDGQPTVSRAARIVAVSLRSPDAGRTAAVEADLVRRLGAPDVRCYVTNRSARWRSAFWPGWVGRGVEVLVSRGPSAGTRAVPTDLAAGAAVVTFGRERPTLASVEPEPCA